MRDFLFVCLIAGFGGFLGYKLGYANGHADGKKEGLTNVAEADNHDKCMDLCHVQPQDKNFNSVSFHNYRAGICLCQQRIDARSMRIFRIDLPKPECAQ